MNKMMTSNALWALAPQYADRVFSGLGEEISAGGVKTVTSGNNDFASMITRKDNSTAVISIHGVLDQETRLSVFSGNIYTLGYDAIRSAINTALANPLVDSILLSIDSPGGIVAGAKELADFIAEASAKKRMCAYADGLCASAAFWLASATGKIYAPATALVGSIGVIMCFADLSAWYAKMGVKMEYIASGKFKAAGQDGRELTSDEREYFEEQMAEIHSIFKNDVRSALSLVAPDSQWAEAQLMPASRALEVGLVSRVVRDESEAIQLLAPKTEEIMDLTQLKAEHPELVDEIRAEALKQAEQEKLKALNEQGNETLALIRLIAGEETAAKVEAVQKTGITASQLQTLQPLLAGFTTQFGAQENGERQLREQLLGAITSATGAPVTQNAPEAPGKSRLVADAERRQGGNRI